MTQTTQTHALEHVTHSDLSNLTIAVIGQGYVGLPLAVEFGKQVNTIGFDISAERVQALNQGIDQTLEVSTGALKASTVKFTTEIQDLACANVYIVTVPTPVDTFKNPDLSALKHASRMLGEVLSEGNVVIYESTVYPGATEEVCVPLLEANSGMKLNESFYAGYSPERINPGDTEHKLPDILKVTSGSTPEAAAFIDQLYRLIITAGTHRASSIRVAEAAKVIENTQRDLNIALINELSLIFNRLGIDTHEVLDAAATKWNFLPFKPGLVGGHCIGVDPYYLTHKAQAIGYHPEVILAGRKINDSMGSYVAEQVIKLMTRAKIHVVGANILVLGLSFKENCPDIRNTKVIDVIRELEHYHAGVDVYDPWVEKETAEAEFQLKMIQAPSKNQYDAIILCVAHHQFVKMGATQIRALGKADCILYDVKGTLNATDVSARL